MYCVFTRDWIVFFKFVNHSRFNKSSYSWGREGGLPGKKDRDIYKRMVTSRSQKLKTSTRFSIGWEGYAHLSNKNMNALERKKIAP